MAVTREPGDLPPQVALIGVFRAGGSLAQKWKAVVPRSIRQGSRRLGRPDRMDIEVTPSTAAKLAAFCVAVLCAPPIAFAESPSGTSPQASAGDAPLCQEEDCDPYAILDQLIYLLPGEGDKPFSITKCDKGFSIFIKGGVSSSDRTLTNK